MIPMVDSNADYAGGAIEISVIIAVSGRPIPREIITATSFIRNYISRYCAIELVTDFNRTHKTLHDSSGINLFAAPVSSKGRKP